MNNHVFAYRLRRLCAFLVGLVYLLAGMFKLMDPVGSALVVEEYYKFLHLGFLMPTAKFVAEALALLEATVGAALISGIWRRAMAWITLILTGFFTLLTLILAIFNPEMDCGCFGEVIELTNTQTFVKNLVLMALSLMAFIPMGNLGENKKRKYVAFGLAMAEVIAFMIYSLINLPFVDHTDFAPGSELVSAKEMGVSSMEDHGYKSTFIYEKNGQEGAFDLDRLPDSTWTYVRTETVKINSFKVEDHSPRLSFSDSAGVYADEKAAEGNVMVLSVYNVKKLHGETWTQIAQTSAGAIEAGFAPLILTASTKEAMDSLETIVPEVREQLTPHLYYADRKDLMALNRSNGGATWINDGMIVKKYRSGKYPASEELLALTGENPLEEMLHESGQGRLKLNGALLYLIAILLII